MPSQKEQLEDHDGYTETIMLLRTIHIAEGDALQFGRSVFSEAAVASVGLTINRDLKAVDIEQIDRRHPRDQNVFGIQIADDEIVFVDGGYGARDVGRYVNQKRPGGFWEFLEPAFRAVQGVNLFGAADLFHDEAGDLAARRIAQNIYRPGREIEQPVIAQAGKRDELLRLL